MPLIFDAGPILRRLKSSTKRLLVPLARRLAPEALGLPIELWGMRVNEHGRLLYAGRDVLGLVEKFGSPVHLLDVARLDANLDAFREPTGTTGRAVEVFYSFKTHPLPWVLARLLERGAGAEVISEYELRLALHLGASPEKIIYNGPGKSDASLQLAAEANIQLLNLNHLEEIERVAAAARAAGRRVRVGVRVTTAAGWTSQFGCSIERGEAMAAFERALATPELEVVALHSHRGVPIYHAEELTSFASEVLRFADALRERLGFVPQILDFGGSLGIATVRRLSPLDSRLATTLQTPIDRPDLRGRLTPETYTRQLLNLVEEQYRAHGLVVPRIVIEPGRALTGNSQALAARVMALRQSPDGLPYAVLDAGINIASILTSEQHQMFRVTGFGSPPTNLYRLVGPICQPGDVISHCVRLPHLTLGDVLLVMDSGAYFEPDSTSFSFQRPGTVAIESDRVEVIRRAESFDDMLARDHYRAR